jgi:2-(1,2-epoxy-1,2-dihydrophenyl)acetyl-CoA isomerase
MADVEVINEAGVRWIALNRPESKNGLTDAVNQQLIDALDGAATDKTVRAVVVTGTGGNFCSGLDLKAMASGGMGGFENVEEHMRKYFHGLIRAVRKIEKPVVALVDGAAVGYGADLAFACDMRIGTERTRFGEVFVKRGLMPDGGGTWSLPRIVGVRKALELYLLSERFDAREAQRIGLVNRVVHAAALDSTVNEWAQSIATGPAVALRNAKRLLRESLDRSLSQQLRAESVSFGECAATRDFEEGLRAFFERRPPRFGG